MDHVGVIALFYAAGLLMLAAEVFIPTGGLLMVGALTCLGIAVFNTFTHSATAGLIGAVGCCVAIPTIYIVGLKNVHRLPFGDKLSPPNPTLTEQDRAFEISSLQALLGAEGVVVTPLRPVGVCEFNGRRIQCVAESGLIETGAAVVGVDVQVHNLVVRLRPRSAAASINAASFS